MRALLVFFALGDRYDDACEEIISHAQRATSLHRTGDVASANGALEQSKKAYHTAKGLSPKEPQADINFGQVMLNTNHLQEAIKHFKLAKPLLDVSNADGHAFLDDRMAYAEYGLVSMERDRVYEGGQGNITRALELMEQQIA